MGTCVSKCCSNPSPPFNSSPDPQDKLVISQSLSTPANPLSIDLSKVQKTTPSSSSSSSSSLSSAFSSHSNTTNSTYSRSSLMKDRSFSNEFSLSCAKENPHIIILDPHKHSVAKPKPNKYPVKPSPPPSKSVQGPKKQSIAGAKQSLPSKRERSSSPPILANRKSMKTELSSAIHPTITKFSSPSAHWRSANATIKRQRHEVGMSGNAFPFQVAEWKEKLLPSSPCNSSSRQISSAEKKRETYVRQIHHTNCEVGENGCREVFSEHSSRIPLMEDLNNPLISMDCFIFI